MYHYVKNAQIPANIKRVKIDVGLGCWNVQSLNWLTNETDLCVFAFEPNDRGLKSCMKHMLTWLEDECVENFIFKKNVKETNYIVTPKNTINIFPVALNDIVDPTTMSFYNMAEDTGTSSLFRPVDPNLGTVQKVQNMPVFSLKHFFDLFPWDRFEYIDYIKIDAQGADLAILKSAGKYLSDRVVYVTAEAESKQYENCEENTEENMVKFLEEMGFERVTHPNTHDPTFLNKKFENKRDEVYIWQL
jgi:hypothetical protein